MTFQEAKALAMMNPGSVLTRDDSGEFIVVASDGKPIRQEVEKDPQKNPINATVRLETGSGTDSAIIRRLRSELDEAWREIFNLRKAVPSALFDLPGIEELNKKVVALRDEVSELRKLVDRIPSRAWVRFDEERAAIAAEKLAEKQRRELETKTARAAAALHTRQNLMSRLRSGAAAPHEMLVVIENPGAFDASPEDIKLAMKLLREG